jgi:hypothetical protein
MCGEIEKLLQISNITCYDGGYLRLLSANCCLQTVVCSWFLSVDVTNSAGKQKTAAQKHPLVSCFFIN